MAAANHNQDVGINIARSPMDERGGFGGLKTLFPS